ncbi:hypothetical protein ACGF3G_28320 [Streptomyces sp. NPDC048179]|uniref:hypothetical protein n=1 Tax=Streptomyces sp. NPDC048179 TaxID=3365506 RepID=UPI0037178616
MAACGWRPVEEGHGDLVPLRRSWSRTGSPVRLCRVVIGLHPVGVTVGRQGGVGWSSSPGSRAVRRTVRKLRKAVSAQGAVPMPDSGLAGYVADTRRRWATAVDIAFKIEQLEFLLGHRHCPRCAQWGEPAARWCWSCEYEFGGEDDHARDAASIEARRRIDWLRGQSLDGPDIPAPASAPLSSWRPGRRG